MWDLVDCLFSEKKDLPQMGVDGPAPDQVDGQVDSTELQVVSAEEQQQQGSEAMDSMDAEEGFLPAASGSGGGKAGSHAMEFDALTLSLFRRADFSDWLQEAVGPAVVNHLDRLAASWRGEGVDGESEEGSMDAMDDGEGAYGGGARGKGRSDPASSSSPFAGSGKPSSDSGGRSLALVLSASGGEGESTDDLSDRTQAVAALQVVFACLTGRQLEPAADAAMQVREDESAGSHGSEDQAREGE